jgi:carboxylesterase
MGFSKINWFRGIVLFTLFLSCGSEPEILDSYLDGDVIFDPSLYSPSDYLVSHALPKPDPIQAATPVIIVSHGYSASTFEWDEFREWNDGSSNLFISQVLLGGHGRTYDDFKNSTWKDWLEPILTEYERLVAAGYSNINFAGSSTSGALLLNILRSGYFNGKITPKNIFLIDPIVIPSNKSLTIVGVVGPMLGYTLSGNSSEEDTYWYHFRPQETLQELMKLINIVRKDLEDGITLPIGCNLKVYKSISDPTADPASAVLIYKGLKTASGEKVDVEMIDSKLHVFTRLNLRNAVTTKDIQNKENTFLDMKNRMLQ